MSSRIIKKYLRTLVTPKSWLGGHSLCPFVEDIIDDIPIVEYTDEAVHTICSLKSPLKVPAAVIYCIGKSDIWLDNKAQELEDEYPEIAVLWHHPAHPRYIKEHKMPSPGIPILIIQDKEELRKAKAQLKESGYYSYWK